MATILVHFDFQTHGRGFHGISVSAVVASSGMIGGQGADCCSGETSGCFVAEMVSVPLVTACCGVDFTS